ncbi:MAG: 7-cyano-7-deazaguanine synthase, partial [Flavobacteriaceae bacterium]
MKKAIVLLSGGQDSTTCLYWAKKEFNNVQAIGFDYGQMHSQELKQAKVICKKAEVKYKIFNVKNLLAHSSLTEHSNHNEASYINKDLPASFTAGRNILFLTIAASYGAEIGAGDLITGVCQTDYSGYPDCRKTTMDSLQTTLSLGIGAGDFRIHTPLMYLNKAQTWKMAKDLECLDIIIQDTLTDYDGNMTKNEWGFGLESNPATKLRVKG